MKTKTQHTPTPWTYHKHKVEEGWGLTGIWSGKKQVFGSEGGWDSGFSGISEEDADFIVRAVNSHEALLRDLKAAILDLEFLNEKYKNELGDHALLPRYRETMLQAEKGK